MSQSTSKIGKLFNKRTILREFVRRLLVRRNISFVVVMTDCSRLIPLVSNRKWPKRSTRNYRYLFTLQLRRIKLQWVKTVYSFMDCYLGDLYRHLSRETVLLLYLSRVVLCLGTRINQCRRSDQAVITPRSPREKTAHVLSTCRLVQCLLALCWSTVRRQTHTKDIQWG